MSSTMSEQGQITAILKALASDPEVGPFAERIRLRPGDPWRIEGEVGSVAARRKAVRVARRSAPGLSFEDAVRLEREICRSDQGLARAVREALRTEPVFQGVPVVEPGVRPPAAEQPWIGVIAHDGVVYLGGRLDLAGRSVAEALAWETAACSDVVNLISREPDPGRFDEAVAEAVHTLVAEHPALFGQRIAVSSAHGEITLEGEVSDPRQREIAVGLCWLIPEVREVHDRLAPADASAQPRS